MKTIFLGFAILFGLCSQQANAFTVPDSNFTPGVLCTKDDPNFKDYAYPEHIARCNRNVGTDEKLKIAVEYGNIPKSDWPKYEFDHMIPLCAGGSDDSGNLWPQPIDEAHKKDVLENDICLAMQAGTLSQAQAVQKVKDWFASGGNSAVTNISLDEQKADSAVTVCQAEDSTVVRFSMINANQIKDVSVALIEQDGDHEALKSNRVINGRKIHSKSNLLQGYLRYILNPKSDDKMDLMIPEVISTPKQFEAYLKVGFEGNYPSLKKLNCY